MYVYHCFLLSLVAYKCLFTTEQNPTLSETKKLEQGRSLAHHSPSALGRCSRGWHHSLAANCRLITTWLAPEGNYKEATVFYICRLVLRRGQVGSLDWPQMEIYVVNTGHSGITSPKIIIYKARKEDRRVRWLLRVGRNENKQVYRLRDIYILKHPNLWREHDITYLDHPRVSISEMSWE